MSMSEEEINALNENLKQLNETMTIMVETMGAVTNQSKLTSKELGKLKTSVKDTDDAIDDLEEGTVKAKGALKNLTESTKENERQQNTMRDATRAAWTAVTGFADALISAEKGFTKFGKPLKAAGDAIAGISLIAGGPVAKGLGLATKASTVIATAHFEQADAVFKARNELFKFAGAGSITSNELLDMGQAIGLTHDQLESLIKPLRAIGPDLLTLGLSAGDGAKKFGEIGAVEEETRKRFIRMGVMPEELLETQADYIRLQRMAGMQDTIRMKTGKQIQEDSLKYAESLKVLSEFTGLEAEEVKKRQQAVLNDFRFQAMMTQRNQQERELRSRGDVESIAQADEMRRVTQNMTDSIATAAALSPELANQAKSLILTQGNITELTSNFGILGVNTKEFYEAMEKGNPEAMLRLLQNVGERVTEQAARFGDTVGYLDDETLKILGLTPASMEFITRYMTESGKDFVEAYQEIAERVRTAGAGGIDTLADNQATLITAQMELAAGFSNLLQNTNPLMQGFNITTISVYGLAAAAGIAATALGAMAAFRGGKALLGALRGTKEAAVITGSRFGRAASTVGRVAGRAALPLAATMTAYDAYKGFTADPNASISGRFRNAGSSALSGMTFGMLGSDPADITARSGETAIPNASAINSVPQPDISNQNSSQQNATSTTSVPLTSIQQPLVNLSESERLLHTNQLLTRVLNVLENIEYIQNRQLNMIS